MADLISREALVKELEEWYARVGNETVQDRLVQNIISYAMDDVNDAEAVDAVEVVRCKDCANRGDEIKCPLCQNNCYWNDDERCTEWDFYDETEDDGFCHKGRKKDAVD